MGRHDPGAGQYCPISRTLDVVGERWSLLILRDMMTGTTRFNDLARGLPGLSRTLLTKRLRHLERFGVVERSGTHYVLTASGRALEPVVFGLAQWGAEWMFGDPLPDELDAQLLVWWMHSRVDTSGLAGERHVLHLRFADDARRFWIVVEHGTPVRVHERPRVPGRRDDQQRRRLVVCRVAGPSAAAVGAPVGPRPRRGAHDGDAPARRGAAAEPRGAVRRCRTRRVRLRPSRLRWRSRWVRKPLRRWRRGCPSPVARDTMTSGCDSRPALAVDEVVEFDATLNRPCRGLSPAAQGPPSCARPAPFHIARR